jgi:hypothetical protein
MAVHSVLKRLEVSRDDTVLVMPHSKPTNRQMFEFLGIFKSLKEQSILFHKRSQKRTLLLEMPPQLLTNFNQLARA